MIKQNLDDLDTFDQSEMLDLEDQSDAIKMASTFDDDSQIEVSQEDLLEKLSSIWNVKPRERKKNSKLDRPKGNTIVFKL